jgi:ParB family chromosome partitioning protein
MEEAKSFAMLMELNGWNATELSQNINVSKGKVSKSLALLKLPEELQTRIEAGEISPSTAYELAKVKDEGQQKKLAERAASGQMTQLEVAKVSAKPKSNDGKRRSTNESIKTSDNVRVTITARRDLGEQGMLNALLEAAEMIRARSKKGAKVA